jgi:hypothetical protein
MLGAFTPKSEAVGICNWDAETEMQKHQSYENREQCEAQASSVDITK